MEQPGESLAGLAVVAMGLPAYVGWRWRHARASLS
jgi:hypothetical protein